MKLDSYIIDKHSVSSERIRMALVDENFVVKRKEEKWYELMERLPKGIKCALLLELTAGNKINSFQYSNWPQNGSILVSLEMPFKVNFIANDLGLKLRILNDAHYWNQDIYQTVEGVDYLLIC